VTAQGDAGWQAAVAPFIGPNTWKSIFQLTSTLTLLAAALTATYWATSHSLLLGVLTLPLASGLLIRSFIFMHDCAHGSFFRSKRANDITGVVTGLLAFTPYAHWRRDHAIHHASSGDLDRRGHGDVTTWTVREYLAKSRRERFMYRLSRHPVLLLAGGPFYLLYTLRFPAGSTLRRGRQLASVWGTNVALLALAAGVVWLWGWRGLAVWGAAYYLAAATGVWLFYVQHQFEDAYWESHAAWDYEQSAMRGSSHLRLPRLLQWFTGNIGLHHVHHLAPRIPNYNLQRCHDADSRFQSAPVITIAEGIRALRLALWDEERRRLVGFDQIGQRAK
jgi:omega-6 fatty acid desaturase (delta-12 desaturase)